MGQANRIGGGGEAVLDYAGPRAPRGRAGGGREALWLLVGGYLLFTALACGALHLPGVGVTGQEFGVRRTLFAAVNATTLTGFQHDVGSTRPGADLLRLVLTLGGTVFSLTAGGMAVVRIAGMRYADRHVAAAAAVATLVATLAGAAFLLDAERELVPALLQAASAFGNSGLYGGRLPGVLDWQTHVVLLPLALAGGLGVPVLMELFDRITGGRGLSRHSRTVLLLAAAVYLCGFGMVALLQAAQTSHTPGSGYWRHTLALASGFSVNARTAGLPFELAGAFSRPAQWALIVLMLVGGSPGGTAGGVKTTTVYHLVRGVRQNLRGRPVPRALGVAGCWLGIYLAIVAAGFVLLLNTEHGDAPDRLLFLAVSAVGNVGLSHDPVSITGNGLFTLSALMLAGRLAPLLVLWWMASLPAEEPGVAVG